MCDPVTATVVVTAVAGGMTAYQQYEQGKFQKGVAEYNARVAENEAQDVRNAGVERENIQRRKTAELLSKQRAQLGAANVDLGSGSALQLQEDTELLGEVDALRIRENFIDRADSIDTGAALTRRQGAFAKAAGRNQAGATLLSTAGSVIGTGVDGNWFTPDSAANAA